MQNSNSHGHTKTRPQGKISGGSPSNNLLLYATQNRVGWIQINPTWNVHSIIGVNAMRRWRASA
jgi:hypothetical protein